MNNFVTLGVCILYMLALLNPVGIVCILASMPVEPRSDEFKSFVLRSSIMATCLLIGTMIVGDFLFRFVFQVDLFSLRVAGGVVVFLVGLKALQHGCFYDGSVNAKLRDIAMVPFACPIIAGPASIAASISLRLQYGILLSLGAILIALCVNHLIMTFSHSIGRVLNRINILGAIIRITGLIIMTIGTQMVLDGVSEWVKASYSSLLSS
jgi:multiple antibiotic resistance protein